MITMIAAVARNGVIGNRGTLPWAGKLRTDMEHFVDYTVKRRTALMGRKTYDSIPSKFKPLMGRVNFIATRDKSYAQPGCQILHNESEIIKVSNQVGELVVIGGAEIYNLLMPLADKLVITHVNSSVLGDSFFPPMIGHWQTKPILHQQRDGKNIYPFSIIEYTRY